jgi:2-polyprenyl-6-methoxyphenol hydroxylase-like FAD-dependent oxidoreductase
VDVEFADGSRDSFSLAFGADGVHSRLRQLIFGEEKHFARFLGANVAAFHTANQYGLRHCIKLFEEIDHLVAVYPISDSRIATIFLFRSRNSGFVPHEDRLALVREQFKASGWICRQILDSVEPSTPIFHDSYTQIVMPQWSRGRIALLGDACSCLTMISGQGSQMAMGEAFVIAHELERHPGEFQQAFQAYETFFRPVIKKKQNAAVRLLKIVVPSTGIPVWSRRLAVKLIFSPPFIGLLPLYFGSKSAIKNY